MRRFARILVYTISMYFVTHLIVFFFLFPVGTPLIMFDSRNGYRIKKSVTGLLFTIIGKRLKVPGLENLDPGRITLSSYEVCFPFISLLNIYLL